MRQRRGAERDYSFLVGGAFADLYNTVRVEMAWFGLLVWSGVRAWFGVRVWCLGAVWCLGVALRACEVCMVSGHRSA